VNPKQDLIKLFFDPASVLDAMFAPNSGGGMSSTQISSSQAEADAAMADDAGGGAVDEDGMSSALRDSSAALKCELLQRKRRKLASVSSEAERMRSFLAEYSASEARVRQSINQIRNQIEQNQADLRRYNARNKQLHTEQYRADKRLTESEADLRARFAELVKLDQKDQALQRSWAELERRRAEAEMEAVTATIAELFPSDDGEPGAATAAGGASDGVTIAAAFAPVAGVSSSSSIPTYLRLGDSNEFWKDMLHTEPALIYAVHAKLNPSATGADKAKGDPPEMQLPLLRLGLGQLQSLWRPETLAEMQRIAKASPHLAEAAKASLDALTAEQPGSGSSGGSKNDAAINGVTVPLPFSSTTLAPAPASSASGSDPLSELALERVRSRVRDLQSALHRSLFDEAAEARAQVAAAQVQRLKARELDKAAMMHRGRESKLERKIELLRATIAAVEQEAEQFKAQQLQQKQQEEAQKSVSKQQPPAKRRRLRKGALSDSAAPKPAQRADATASSRSAAPIELLDDENDNSGGDDAAAEAAAANAEAQAMMEDENEHDEEEASKRTTPGQRQRQQQQPPAVALVSSFPSLYPQQLYAARNAAGQSAPAASLSASTAAAAPLVLRTSFLSGGAAGIGGVGPSLVSVPGRSGKAKLAAAFHLLDAVGPDSAALDQLGLRTENLLAVAQAAAKTASRAPPEPPPRENPFGIRTVSSAPMVSLAGTAAGSGGGGAIVGGVAARAAAARKKGREHGGECVVRGHDGRGGTVTLYRSADEVRSANPSPASVAMDASALSNSKSASFPVSSNSSGGSSSGMFSMPNLAFRPTSANVAAAPLRSSSSSSPSNVSKPKTALSTTGSPFCASSNGLQRTASSTDNGRQQSQQLQQVAVSRTGSSETHKAAVAAPPPAAPPRPNSLAAAFQRAASAAAAAAPPKPRARGALATMMMTTPAQASQQTREVVDLLDDDDECAIAPAPAQTASSKAKPSAPMMRTPFAPLPANRTL
jgi:hypothetical protein